MVLPAGDEIHLALHRHRFRCCDCNIAFMEHCNLETGKSYTQLFEGIILNQLARKSVLTISEKRHCSQDLIQSIADTIDHEEFNRRGIQYLSALDEIHLVVDGHSFRKHKMVSMVIEHGTGKLVALLSGEKIESFKELIRSLPEGVGLKLPSQVLI